MNNLEFPFQPCHKSTVLQIVAISTQQYKSVFFSAPDKVHQGEREERRAEGREEEREKNKDREREQLCNGKVLLKSDFLCFFFFPAS